MDGREIFLPMLAMMVLTALVWTYMYARRIPAMYRAGKHAQAYKSPESIAEYLPASVNYPAHNLKNLCELPILFYALCLYVYVVGSTDTLYVSLAWLFVALRSLRSLVHCTRNIVLVRFYLYAAASLVLWLMLFRALIAELGVY